MRPFRTVALLLPAVCVAGALFHAACGKGPSAGPAPDDASADVPWDHTRVPYDSALPPPGPRTAVRADLKTQRVQVAPLMFAAGEMQTSGEPFVSQFAGRSLLGYDRYYLPPDEYLLKPKTTGAGIFTAYKDLFGFSTAVESYEYSKDHMNMVLQQTTAGLSLASAPVVGRMPQATPHDKLRARVSQLLATAGTNVGGFATVPPPASNPLNDLGFPGLWPVFAPYASFDPAIKPDLSIAHTCTSKTGYGGLAQFGNNAVPEYECDYNTLHLNNNDGGASTRAAQLEFTTGPAVLGFTTWKEALWAIDFTGRLHDSQSNQVNAVSMSDAPLVGTLVNMVVGTDPPACGSACACNPKCTMTMPGTVCSCVGTFIGSTPLEGMWGLLMVEEADNAAEWLVSSLTTTDGATLGGFATKAVALAYDYTSPLRWFPTAVSVTEDGGVPYPLASALAIKDATSHSVDLAALLRGEALFFGMTDGRNVPVGQQIGLQLAFDGDPFAQDNGMPDGEETAHDRALSVIRVAFINLDRMHADPTLGVVLDAATVTGGTVTRGAIVTMTSLGHVLAGLRTALMGLNAAVTQYGAPDPDPTLDTTLGILNSLPIHPPGVPDGGVAPGFSARVRQVFTTNAAFVRDVLTRPDGSVANGATIANGVATPTTDAATLDSQSAAIRALIEGFLVTGDETYRSRARLVAQHLESAFYSPPARMYRGVEGGPDQVKMTPELFAWLQSALRETYKALYVPADPVLDRVVLEDRIARANKLYLNGWDDLNADQTVQPVECLAGRLQPAEQILTGELGHDDNGFPVSGGPDRDKDCVMELAHARTASTLASEVDFHSP
jgi:hypothetical protein